MTPKRSVVLDGERLCRSDVRDAKLTIVRRSSLLIVLLGLLGCQAPGTGLNADGVRYFQQGQAQAAVYQFQQAVAANPTSPDAYYNLGAAYHYLGKQNGDAALLTQSETLYHQCLDLSSDHVPCHRALAVLLVDTNRPQSAFTLLERWSTRSPHLSDPRIELARLHEEFGEPEVARRYLGEAIDVDPANSRAWSALARLREGEGQFAQALSNYQQAYSLNRQQPGLAQQINHLQQRLAMGGTPTATNQRMADAPRGWTSR
jgi:tetratricopeptide (TPR) repeat protein